MRTQLARVDPATECHLASLFVYPGGLRSLFHPYAEVLYYPERSLHVCLPLPPHRNAPFGKAARSIEADDGMHG